MKKLFNTKEEADTYYNYILVNTAHYPAYTEGFHTRSQAEKSEMFPNSDSFILTRKQFEKFRAQNKDLF